MHPTSTEIAARIEELYGAPLAELHAWAQDHPPGMLAALLAMHESLADAERSITFHRERLAQLIHPERKITGFEVSHLLDGTRRLAEAVAVRDTQSVSTAAVVHSLAPSRPRPAEPVPDPLTPPVARSATPSAAPSR
ncbi:hypothetical protein V1460_30330 [Streptomyces sp. SCSIO 30461]|uniref:hypothetical protein n=1 Tax=Streptomyces sp. SCSIO 30461 TaxID=3118085 RepID=UPI0030D4B737